jgi:hypothetical protein
MKHPRTVRATPPAPSGRRPPPASPAPPDASHGRHAPPADHAPGSRRPHPTSGAASGHRPLDFNEEEARALLLSSDPLPALAETQTQLHERPREPAPASAELEAWRQAAATIPPCVSFTPLLTPDPKPVTFWSVGQTLFAFRGEPGQHLAEVGPPGRRSLGRDPGEQTVSPHFSGPVSPWHGKCFLLLHLPRIVARTSLHGRTDLSFPVGVTTWAVQTGQTRAAPGRLSSASPAESDWRKVPPSTGRARGRGPAVTARSISARPTWTLSS